MKNEFDPLNNGLEPYDIQREMDLTEYEEDFLTQPDENRPDNTKSNQQENS